MPYHIIHHPVMPLLAKVVGPHGPLSKHWLTVHQAQKQLWLLEKAYQKEEKSAVRGRTPARENKRSKR